MLAFNYGRDDDDHDEDEGQPYQFRFLTTSLIRAVDVSSDCAMNRTTGFEESPEARTSPLTHAQQGPKHEACS